MIKILYIEDEVMLGRIVRDSLETRGFNVLLQEDGGKAVDDFKSFNPDICVLDVMLPNKNGFDIAKEIHESNSDIPFIFLTAKTQSDDAIQGLKLGAADYIRKPFSMEELILRIENVLRVNNKIEENLPDVLQIGKYSFNTKTQLLSAPDEERKLSYRESELLKFLYRFKNEIADRKEILLQIWGDDSFFNSRNLDVYITKLRSYLKGDSTIEILTIKGFGYRFIV